MSMTQRAVVASAFALGFVVLAQPAFAQTSRRRPPAGLSEATEPFDRTFKVGANPELLVSNVAGNIRVSTGSNGQISVKATKRAYDRTQAEARQLLSDLTIAVRTSGDRVELQVEYPRRDRNNGEVEFDIAVPGNCAAELRSVSGSIAVSNVKGELRANTVSGNVSLDSASRIAGAKSVSGNIDITSGAGDATLTLDTVSGRITARGLTAKTIDVSSVSGDIRLTDWQSDRSSSRTVSGAIELSGALARSGRYDFESHSGNVRLTLADQPGFELDTRSFSGNVRSDFSLRTEGLLNSGRRTRSTRSTYGDGSASLQIRTFSGDIAVLRR
jgi:DUF4097 and DUF4098 domain-containing protein YvlB